MAEPDITQSCPESNLKPRDILFINEYKITKNAAQAARVMGYVGKHAALAGYKMLKKESVKQAIEAHETLELAKSEEKLKTFELSKEKFTETAWNKFETVEDEAIKPRYLDIAGRSLGYIGKDGNTTTNNTLIINTEAKNLSTADKWERLRALIDGS